MRETVVIFAKAPRAGAVKTRLGAGIGMGRAAALFRILTEQTVAQAAAGPWRTVIAVDPSAALQGWGNVWPASLQRQPQGGGDLGVRMKRFFNAPEGGPMVIIGADAPGLRTRHLRAAFEALAGADAVFGPADDGGYWLIGLARRRAAPDLFRNVRWSSEHAFVDTRASLPKYFRVTTLETLHDVDEASELRHWRGRSLAR
ncbi:MAG: TIGR04282 family arsenosugar biosynthesis glycosyltransferase [Pseudomonadota bacterium]